MCNIVCVVCLLYVIFVCLVEFVVVICCVFVVVKFKIARFSVRATVSSRVVDSFLLMLICVC